MTSSRKRWIYLLQEFSIPLIAGVVAALAAANLAPEWYHYWFGSSHGEGGDVFQLPGSVFGHHLSLSFFINDVFMVFFFGVAAKEITEACLPGGTLNPPKKAINPLFATLGGVVGPVGVFFLGVAIAAGMGIYASGGEGAAGATQAAAVQRGWGIPTATDIALAWLVARAVFGRGHPAINFLLLLAVADDAIGLGIIAIFYGDPTAPAAPQWLLLVALGMAVALVLRRMKVNSWVPYIALGGPLAWSGLVLAHLHAALALVFIVPFLPGPRRDTGMFRGQDEVDVMGDAVAHDLAIDHSPLHMFEHQLKAFVDFGLFFFAFGNAGVQFSGIGTLTWIVLGSLIVGKTVGIVFFGWLGVKIGFPLPARMGIRELAMAGFIAALGLTVALFVAGAAFPTDALLQGQAKMGALFSGFVALAAILIGRAAGIGRPAEAAEHPVSGSAPEATDPSKVRMTVSSGSD